MRKTERHTSCYEQFHYEIHGFRILLVETHVPSFELVGTDDLDHGECIALTAYAVKCIAATMERRETSASNLLLFSSLRRSAVPLPVRGSRPGCAVPHRWVALS